MCWSVAGPGLGEDVVFTFRDLPCPFHKRRGTQKISCLHENMPLCNEQHMKVLGCTLEKSGKPVWEEAGRRRRRRRKPF